MSPSRSCFPALLSQTYTFPENKVRTPIWAPLIEEKDIIYTRWFLVDVRTGYWKGREVGRAHFRLFTDQHGFTRCATDVIVGYEDHYLKRVDATMKGYRALQGFDLTYPVLAHVISSDGSVIGIVTEPEVGRLVQYRDRTLVYQAIAQLQQHHLIFNGLHYSKIHILDGKVRLSNVASIAYIEDPIELKEEAEERHWGPLKRLFEFLDPGDEVFLLSLERVSRQATLKLLPDHPSPERPLFVRFIWGTYFPEGFDRNKLRFGPGNRDQRTNGRARKRGVLSLSVELVSEAAEALIVEADEAGVKDLPLSVKGARGQPRRETHPVFHPYRQRPRRLLLESSVQGE
jgi:hypothetical protein